MIQRTVKLNVVETKCTDYKPLLPRIGGVRTEKVNPLKVRTHEKHQNKPTSPQSKHN
jgi:hypothetical protein